MVLNYFISRSGRKIMTILAGTTTAGLFLVNYVPHTFGLDRYKKIIQCYRNGQPLSLSPKQIELLNDAAKIIDIDISERYMLNPFSVFGFDLFSAGSTNSKFGAIIGIPFNYDIDNVADIQNCGVCYRGEKVNWNTESGKLLEDALVLTNDEKLFGLCQILLQLQTHHVLMNSLFPSVSFLTVYSIGHYLNQSLDLLRRPLILRMCLYFILGLFGLGSWSFMKDYNQVTCDAEIDKKLSSISPKLTEAGIAFYEKQLKKNIALKEIGKDNSFTAKGNINYFLRQKSLPLTVRKSFFENKYKEYLDTLN
ncbi:transmembrane protein 177 [Calliphora vicina]|uniref:transmembrane protein 177 n=1 Tax=Calliphora vicina TaxID=7373 RepID=UPI00325AE669